MDCNFPGLMEPDCAWESNCSNVAFSFIGDFAICCDACFNVGMAYYECLGVLQVSCDETKQAEMCCRPTSSAAAAGSNTIIAIVGTMLFAMIAGFGTLQD